MIRQLFQFLEEIETARREMSQKQFLFFLDRVRNMLHEEGTEDPRFKTILDLNLEKCIY